MLAPPMFSVLSAVALLCVDALTSAETLDYYLYAADSSFGTQIGFAVARVLAHVEWLRLAAEAAYINLPVAVTVTYALLDADSPADARRFLRAMVLIGVGGWATYVMFPAAGSIVVFRDL